MIEPFVLPGAVPDEIQEFISELDPIILKQYVAHRVTTRLLLNPGMVHNMYLVDYRYFDLSPAHSWTVVYAGPSLEEACMEYNERIGYKPTSNA